MQCQQDGQRQDPEVSKMGTEKSDLLDSITQRLSPSGVSLISEPRIVPRVAGRVVAGVDDIFKALIVLAHETLHRVGHCPGLLARPCLGRSEIRAPDDAAAPDAER